MEFVFFFFFQAEDGIRDYKVTGVQTCALPISCANAFSNSGVSPGNDWLFDKAFAHAIRVIVSRGCLLFPSLRRNALASIKYLPRSSRCMGMKLLRCSDHGNTFTDRSMKAGEESNGFQI